MKILVVDDDPGVRRSLERALVFEGYDVETAENGADALDKVLDEPDALVLDVMMPKVDGLEVCRRLRAMGNDIPILVLTARHGVTDRVEGLDAGADDYVVKPFALEELLARLRALLRRTIPVDEAKKYTVGDLTLDTGSRIVNRGERVIELTRTEFELLELLMRNPGQVMTRDVIYDRVWGYDWETSSNSLDVYIGYLRRKTEGEGESRIIHTVRGVGYVARES
ncbi:MAG: response regulator transcription factor [Acidimicrobiia bacterium]|nr:response regulator transcription factor [Acidimicrobiia bacterium]MBT8215061.1 response regulator transcription factor [Acidimicrobiia bacterium]NNF69182.1 response regulator transcription factor [Acidimicrobiia bacterium]NNK92617.1 response regulator transcription factor [Acidimicrobiia bacterium]